MILSNAYALVAVGNIIVLSLVFALAPGLRDGLLAEDRFMENLTVFLFLAGFLAGLGLTLRLRGTAFFLPYSVVPLIGLIGLLDELSFGERIFHITMPTVEGVKVDAVHDVVLLTGVALKHHGNYLIYLLILAVGGLVTALTVPSALRNVHRLPDIVKRYAPLRFLLLLAGFGVIATLIDLDIAKYQILQFVEELAEVNGALALLFASFAIASRPAQQVRFSSPTEERKMANVRVAARTGPP